MDEEPCEPGDEAAEAHAAGFHDGGVFADDGHHAFVEVAEGGAELEGAVCVLGFGESEVFLEDGGDVCAHLDGGGGDAGDGFVVGVADGDEVASDEDVRVAGEGEVREGGDAACAVGGESEFGGEGVGGDAGGPDDG